MTRAMTTPQGAPPIVVLDFRTSPELKLCLDRGTQMRVSKSMLTGLPAEALYRQSTTIVLDVTAGAAR